MAARPDVALGDRHWGLRLTPWTLRQAVASWLRYLGVAESLEVIDRGPLGHEVKVNIPGEPEALYLTQVGSGVAQALPVVVMCLAAQPGAMLLIELRAPPPSRGADAAGRPLPRDGALGAAGDRRDSQRVPDQPPAPSHRRGDGADLVPLVQIYFAEKKDGASTFRPLVVDRYGAIESWPDGFFGRIAQIEIDSLLAGADKMDADADALEASGEHAG